MTLAEQAADKISAYLTTGMHHSTKEAHAEIARIVESTYPSAGFPKGTRVVLTEEGQAACLGQQLTGVVASCTKNGIRVQLDGQKTPLLWAARFWRKAGSVP